MSGDGQLPIGRRIARILDLDPAAPAVHFAGTWHSWGDLARGAEAVNRICRDAALSDSAIGMVLRNRPASVAAIAGALTTGHSMVLFQPHQPDRALVAELERTRPPVVAAGPVDWARAPVRDAVERIGAIGVELVEYADAARENGVLVRPVPGLEHRGQGPHRAPAHGVAVEIATSGTTGAPKRVQLTYRMLGEALGKWTVQRDHELSLRTGASIIWMPFTHIGGLWHAIFGLVEGRRMVLMDRFEPNTWASLVQEHKPKIVGLPPAAMRMVLDARIDREALTSLRAVRVGTAPMPPELGLEFERTYGIPPLVSYGATEFAGSVVGWTLPDYERFGEDKRGSTGRPRPGVEVRVVDEVTGEALAVDDVGVLEIRSKQLGDEKPRWVRTTDRARVDRDGFVWLQGRADDVIIRGGFKVPLLTVAAVLERHPAVAEAAVVGRPDRRLGEVPVAAVRLRDEGSATPDDLLGWCRQELPAYQVPADLRIVDEFARTESLKVKHDAVRQLFDSHGDR